MRDQYAGLESAGVENVGDDIVWNTVYFLYLISSAGCDHSVCLKGAAVASEPSWTINHDSSDD